MIHLDSKEIAYISKLVHDYSGIVIERVTTRQVEKKISDQMKRFNVSRIKDYISILEAFAHNPVAMESLISDLTVSESYFFRNPSQFEYMLEVLLPDFFDRNSGQFPFRIWSAGCSRGEEAYSIAMLAKFYRSQVPTARFTINAGDINSRNLQMAREGIFSGRSLREILPGFESRFGFKLGTYNEDEDCTVSKDLRDMVEFQRLNLKNLQSLQCLTGSDIIFCRNVLIYFDDDLRNSLVNEFYKYLNPGGVVFLGESECLPITNNGFELVNFKNSYAFRKPQTAMKKNDRKR